MVAEKSAGKDKRPQITQTVDGRYSYAVVINDLVSR